MRERFLSFQQSDVPSLSQSRRLQLPSESQEGDDVAQGLPQQTTIRTEGEYKSVPKINSNNKPAGFGSPQIKFKF